MYYLVLFMIVQITFEAKIVILSCLCKIVNGICGKGGMTPPWPSPKGRDVWSVKMRDSISDL